MASKTDDESKARADASEEAREEPSAHDTVTDHPPSDVHSTAVSLVNATGATMLSTPGTAEPEEHEDGQLLQRLGELERKQDELAARVRLLEKGDSRIASSNPLLWLLFLPLLTLLWWVTRLLSG